MEVLQLLVSGNSQRCVYRLIALGFVLIYKAKEMVNFAQGDLMILVALLALSKACTSASAGSMPDALAHVTSSDNSKAECSALAASSKYFSAKTTEILISEVEII